MTEFCFKCGRALQKNGRCSGCNKDPNECTCIPWPEDIGLTPHPPGPIEAIGILEELQVSPNLNESEKKIVKDVSERIGGLMKYALNRYSSIRADIYEQKKPEQVPSFEPKKLSGNR